MQVLVHTNCATMKALDYPKSSSNLVSNVVTCGCQNNVHVTKCRYIMLIPWLALSLASIIPIAMPSLVVVIEDLEFCEASILTIPLGPTKPTCTNA